MKRVAMSLKDEAVRMYSAGAGTPGEIADALGVSKAAVQHWVKQAGLAPNWKLKHNPGAAARKKAVAEVMARGGDAAAVDAVAGMLGVPRSSVLAWLRADGKRHVGRRISGRRKRKPGWLRRLWKKVW